MHGRAFLGHARIQREKRENEDRFLETLYARTASRQKNTTRLYMKRLLNGAHCGVPPLLPSCAHIRGQKLEDIMAWEYNRV